MGEKAGHTPSRNPFERPPSPSCTHAGHPCHSGKDYSRKLAGASLLARLVLAPLRDGVSFGAPTFWKSTPSSHCGRNPTWSRNRDFPCHSSPLGLGRCRLALQSVRSHRNRCCSHQDERVSWSNDRCPLAEYGYSSWRPGSVSLACVEIGSQGTSPSRKGSRRR
jgi:hypothetical protein